ncbi:hypothetical protein Taro_009843 [Colocasia esculenta]|uniref:Uncharacterized protein n=1 Tax=Colocasia esculenta TaxID=4460 RepID=A0A843U206_COLES|nr:hypothetical protein [Colocasia esculenta]
MKKRSMLLDEGVEAEDQLRARKKKKLVRAAPQQSEEETEEEKCKAAGTAEQEAPRIPSAARPEVAHRMANELRLIVLSGGSESSVEEQEEVPTPPGPNEGREEGVARTEVSSTGGAEQDTASDAAETFARRSEGNEETPVAGEGTSPCLEVSEKDVPEETTASATGATPTGETPALPKEVALPWPPCPYQNGCGSGDFSNHFGPPQWLEKPREGLRRCPWRQRATRRLLMPLLTPLGERRSPTSDQMSLRRPSIPRRTGDLSPQY